MAKKHTITTKRSKLSISHDKLKKHFQEHFATHTPELELPPELAQPENVPHLKDIRIEVNEGLPNAKEIEDVLKTFKKNKRAGTDKMKTEGLKYSSIKKLIDALILLFTMMWTNVHVPAFLVTCLYYLLAQEGAI